MGPDTNNGGHWDRVAAELRACREAQQRAWGDIDNTTLGRFLAGEVTPDEQQQIENALEELPELRKLTELVRDVLGEFDLSVSEPAAVPQTIPYGPATLPFRPPQPPSRATPALSAPKRGGRPWLRDSHFRQRAGLVAAAGLLLMLGFALPRSGGGPSQAEPALAMSHPVATRVTAFEPDGRLLTAHFDGNVRMVAPFKDDNPGVALIADEQGMLDRITASVLALETEGKKHEAETLARQYTSNLRRKALVYQEKGDLARAEPALHQAYALCDRTWGPEAPESVRTRNSLAGVYEVALNTLPTSTYASAAADFDRALKMRAVPAPQVPVQMFFRPGDSPRLPAASLPERDSAPLPPRAAPAGRTFAPGSPPSLARASGPAPASGHAHRGTPRTHHSYHGAHVAQSASALRDRITRKSQSELKSSVAPVLIKALREAANPAERQRLARALGQLGPAARDAVPVLIDCYHRASNDSERVALLSAFSDIGPAARQALPVVLEVVRNVKDEPASVYLSARRALIHLAPVARCRHGKDADKHPGEDALTREVLQQVNSPEGRSGIVDDAECFSVSALRQSQDQIRQLATTYRLEVLIETVPGKPADADAKESQALAGNGVYLRINKDTPAVQVYLSETLRQQGVSDAELRQAMEPHLRRNDFDGGLQAGVEFLSHFEAKKIGD